MIMGNATGENRFNNFIFGRRGSLGPLDKCLFKKDRPNTTICPEDIGIFSNKRNATKAAISEKHSDDVVSYYK